MLQNLRLLKNDMQLNDYDWIISSFMFLYNKIKYIVLVQLFNEKLKKKINMYLFN
ncbi:MAG: DUF6037 family protein [Lactobacillaceae bacterium]